MHFMAHNEDEGEDDVFSSPVSLPHMVEERGNIYYADAFEYLLDWRCYLCYLHIVC